MRVMTQNAVSRPSAWMPVDAAQLPGIQAAIERVASANSIQTTAVGPASLLGLRKVAVFSSRRCPPERMLLAFDWARALPERGTALIGGFHSPIEQECLAIVLRRQLPVIVCAGRSFARMRPATEWRHAVEEGRMLILSTFPAKARRLTEEQSVERNHFAAALADEIFFVHAEPGGHAESLRDLAVSWGKTLKERL